MAVPATGKIYANALHFTTTTGSFVDQQLIDLPTKCIAWIEIDAVARDDTGDLAWHYWKKVGAFSRDAVGGAITNVGTVQTLVTQGSMTKPSITLGHDGGAKIRVTAHSGETRNINWSVTVRYQVRAD